jgi:hypothetical protein
MTTGYRWKSPGDWLNEQLSTWTPEDIKKAAEAMAGKLDSDTIQDLYELEMDTDGYFVPVTLTLPNCPHCGQVLEKVYVHELDSQGYDLEIKDGKIVPETGKLGRVDMDSGPYCYNCATNLEHFVEELGLAHIQW